METPGNWQSVLGEIVDSFPHEIVEHFRSCRTEAEKIAFVETFNFIRNVSWISAFFNTIDGQSLKNLATGVRLKEEGTELFRRKRYRDAVRKYSEAIVKIPAESDELAIVYGNRSASLFYLHYYQECIEDIESAVNCNFPAEKLHKLLVRQINCQIELGHHDQVEQGLKQLKEYIQSAEVDSKVREQLKQEVEKLGKKLEKMDRKAIEKISLSLPHVSYGLNKLLVQASSALDIQYTVEQGRFLIANQDIGRGDTLIVERPYAAVLLPKNMDTHCYNCYGKLKLNFYPCGRCTSVRYCCMKCERSSWENFHRTECPYLPLLHSVGIAHLSFKVVITARLQYLREFMKKQSTVESSQKYKGFDETGTYCRSYQSVYDLMTHTEDMDTEDLLQYTLTALLLLEILKHSGWFGSRGNTDCEMKDSANIKDKRMTDDEMLVGSLLLRHILQLVCNAHAITELQCNQTATNSVVEEQNQVRIATAIYPTASLMNHSCDPSIIASFNRDTLVVRAVKDISKGEEVFNCYGPHHKRMSLDERQQSLQQQYFFTCKCKPCTAGENTSQFLYSYRCRHCEGPSITNSASTIRCQTCGVTDNLDIESVRKADSLFQDGVKLLQENRNRDALHLLLECCKLRQKCFYRHNKVLSETQDCIARCYASLGYFEDSAKFLRQSIEAVKVIYGLESIETGNELQKLTEILISAHRWQEALDCVHDAIRIFTEHYSESHETVQELCDMKEQLVQVLECSR